MKDLGDHFALMKQQIREKTWTKTINICIAEWGFFKFIKIEDFI